MQRIIWLLVMLMALAGCGSGDTSDSPSTTAATTTTAEATTTTRPPNTTTSTTTTSTTTTRPATTDPKESATFPGAGDTALLTSVDVSADATIDFGFEGDVVPAYRAEYVEPPIVADASGTEIDLDGEAFLQIVVSPGAGVDLSGDEPRETFTGTDRFAVESVDDIVELAETGDFESVLTWTIGLTARHPFTIEATPGSLVVDLAVSNEATAMLLGTDPARASSGELACGSFAPTELDLTPNTDTTAPVMIFADPADFQMVVAPTETRNELSRAVSTIDGRKAAHRVGGRGGSLSHRHRSDLVLHRTRAGG